MKLDTNNRIVIAGAGPVGAMTAAFLAKRGFDVTLFESRVDLRRNDISAGRSINLALANRGIYPLQQLGLMDSVNDMVIPMRGRMVHDVSGNTNFQAYGQREEEVIYSISRGGLNALLLDAAEATGKVDIRFNHRCTAVDLDNNSADFVENDSGEVVTLGFDRLIGADGANSVVRRAILEKECERDELQPLGHAYKELEIPAAADGGFQIHKESLHIWPRGGYMLIALPNLDGSFTVTLFLPAEGENSFASLKDKASVEAFFQDNFADAMAMIPNLVDDYFANPTGSLATVRCAPWRYQDKAVLLGDAAHAIVPFHGQGMNCGFEDSSVLDDCVANADNWEQAFADYQALRFDNGNAIADMAIENYIEMRDSVANPLFLLKKAVGFQLEQRFGEYFAPRYALVMFHRLPYAEAQRLGKINDEILTELCADIDDVSQVDWALAERLVKQKLKVFR